MNNAAPVAIPTGASHLRLRPADTADDGFACALFAATRREAFERGGLHGPMLEQLLQQQFRLQTAGYLRQFPGAVAYIIERHCEAIGRSWLSCRSEAWHIIDIALLPQHCGQGIGTAIFRGIEMAARSRGVGALTLTVSVGNVRARRLYRRLDFSTAATSPDGHYVNMIKPLAADIVWPCPDC